MPRITLSIPDELKQKLDQHPQRNWPELFRSALRKKVEQLKKFEKITNKSKV